MPDPILISSAGEAERLGRELIAQVHTHLKNVGILFLFTSQHRTRKGRSIMGSVSRLSPVMRYLSAGDGAQEEAEEMLLLIDEAQWDVLRPEHRKALVDELLCEIGVDDEKHRAVKVDYEFAGYGEAIARNGLWRQEYKTFWKEAIQGQFDLTVAANEAPDGPDDPEDINAEKGEEGEVSEEGDATPFLISDKKERRARRQAASQ